MKRIFALLLTVTMCLSMVWIAPVQAAEPVNAQDLYIRDPFVLVENGVYYLYGTRGFGQFEVFTSNDLYSWESQGACFAGSADFWGNAVENQEDAEHAYWAPEVHKYTYNGETAYYMLATFTQAGTTNQQASAILKATNPLGPFVPWSDGPITPAGHSCLDATLYVENGTPYLIYAHEWQCACRNYKGYGSMEYIQLSDDLKSAVGQSKQLFTSSDLTSFWEQLFGTQASNVTDGPWVYTNRDGQKFLMWSSSVDVNGDLRYAVLATRFSSLDTKINLKNDTIKLYTDDGGHAMVFKDLHGSEILALHTPNSGDTRANFFHLDSAGTNMELTPLHPLVKSGYESYDISNLDSGLVTYTGTQEDALELNINATAKDDAYVEATFRRGAEFNMSDLRYGYHFAGINFNLVGNDDGMMLQMTDWTFYENYILTQTQIDAFTSGGIRIAAARVEGTYCMYIENNGQMERVLEKYMPEKTSAWFDLKLNTWPSAKGAEYRNLSWSIGDNALPQAVASADMVVGGYGYDMSMLSAGMVTYTAHYDSYLELDAFVGETDDAYIEAVFRQGADFNMNDLRYGFRFGDVDLDLIGSNNEIGLQITDWTFFENYTLTQEQAAAFAGSGIRVGAERSNGVYRMYIENNGTMECVLTKEIPEKANSQFNLKLQTWYTATGAQYQNLTWKIGNFANNQILSGKNVSILGDSISTYAGISNAGITEGYSVWYNGDWQNVLSGAEETYWGQLIAKYDMNLLVNNSCGGNQLLWNSGAGVTAPAGYMRVENLAYPGGKKPNMIFLFMGTNDYIGNNPLGELTQDTYGSVISEGGYITPSTFTEAYIITIEKAISLYPNAQIYAFTLIPSHYNTNWEVLDAYNVRIRQLAKHYDQVTLVDIAQNSGITTENYWSYTFDGTHPNHAGMNAIAQVLETAILDNTNTKADVFYLDFEDAETGDFLMQDPESLWMDRYDKGWSWVDSEKYLVLSGAEGDASIDFWFNNVPVGSTVAFDFRMPATSAGWDRLAIALGSSDLDLSWRFEQWQGWTSVKYPGAEDVNEAFAIGTWYSVKMDWNGNTVSVKLWERDGVEPADYTFSIANNAFTADNKVRFNYVTNAQSYLHLDNIQMYSTSAQKNVQVITPESIAGYATFAEAAANVGEGYIKLLTDIHEEVTVDSITVDLNGKNLSGITATGTVYAFDSYANNHMDLNLGKLTVNGNVATDWYAPNGNRYIAIENEGSYTMHHIYVGITKLSLKPSNTGFGYKAEFWCDSTVQAMIESESYSLWLTEDIVANRSIDGYKQIVTLRLQNFDMENYGASKVNAKVSMTLSNGMVLESGIVSYSMQEMVESISANVDNFSADQIKTVQAMLADHDLNWNIDALLNWTE